MPRPTRQEEHENHERWLVSYADFITLLFAFFVVMYSISSVNEGKYRVLSDSLDAAFRSPTKSLEPIQLGQVVRSPRVDEVAPVATPTPLSLAELPPPPVDEKAAEAGGGRWEGDPQGVEAPLALLDEIAAQTERALRPLIEKDLIQVRRWEDWLEVEIKTSILFPSGSARLVTDAIPVLEELAGLLKDFPNPVQVEGFTDTLPINTEVFPSNWELSAARAASVVHVLMRYGVRPDRMVAIGYGEYRPVDDNATAEGRNRNRRVVVVIPAQRDTRRHVDILRMAPQPRTESAGLPATEPLSAP